MVQQLWPVTYAVTNKTKRTRIVAGVRVPGKDDKGKAETVEVPVKTRSDYLQVTTSKSLEAKRGKSRGSSGGSSQSKEEPKESGPESKDEGKDKS